MDNMKIYTDISVAQNISIIHIKARTRKEKYKRVNVIHLINHSVKRKEWELCGNNKWIYCFITFIWKLKIATHNTKYVEPQCLNDFDRKKYDIFFGFNQFYSADIISHISG